MKYHLHHGKDLGVFELDELRRRRDAGLLTGHEYVWHEGMPDWQTLDSVLARQPPPVPTMAKRRRLHPLAIVAIAASCVFVAAFLGFIVFIGVKQVKRSVESDFENLSSDRPEAVEVGSMPIAVRSNTMTMADVNRRTREFRERQWLEGFKARGDRGSPCHPEIVKFLEDWIVYYSDPAQARRGPKPHLEADKLVSRPECGDPLFLAIAGANSPELFESVRRLERAVAAFPQSHHNAYPKFFATVLLGDQLLDQKARLSALDASAATLFREAFRDGSFVEADQPELADIFLTGWGERYFDRYGRPLMAAIPRNDKSFEWLQKLLAGQWHIDEAWRARGGGYADSVSQKGWRGFASHLEQARTNLVAAWKLRPDLPHAPSRMITVAMGESGAEEMREWFDHTLAAQIDYTPAWNSMRFGLRPRWHGSHQAMLALGVRAVDTGRFDTGVPRNLFDVLTDLESELELPFGKHIYGRQDIWPHVQRMYEGYIAEPKQEESRDGWRTTYATVAYFAGKYEVARQQMDALNWLPWTNNLTRWGADLSLLPLEIAARTGKVGDDIGRAERLREQFKLPEALRMCRDIATNGPDERTRHFCNHRAAALATEIELREGRWISWLPTETSDPEWVIASGKLRTGSEEAVEIESGVDGHLLFSRARIGSNFEVKGEFEIVRSSNKDFQAGLVIGLPDFSDQEWYGFRIKRNTNEGQIAAFARGWTKQQIYQPVALNDKTNSFHLVMNSGLINASVNGKEVFREAKPPRALRVPGNAMFLGIGAYHDMNETVIRYRNFQVRQVKGAAGRRE
jgi:hypothetical protein